MNKYLEQNIIIEAFRKNCPNPTDLGNAQHFINIIRNIPAANVRPVVRGEWIDIRPINQSTFERIAIKGAYNKCSLCGRLCFFEENFCPRCGADMRGE